MKLINEQILSDQWTFSMNWMGWLNAADLAGPDYHHYRRIANCHLDDYFEMIERIIAVYPEPWSPQDALRP